MKLVKDFKKNEQFSMHEVCFELYFALCFLYQLYCTNRNTLLN